jgi:hypothetical protein
VSGYGVVANVELPDSTLRKGARVVVLQQPGSADRVLVRGVSRGGRVVTKWTRLRGLKNFRVAWIHDPVMTWPTREAAAEVAERLSPKESK